MYSPVVATTCFLFPKTARFLVLRLVGSVALKFGVPEGVVGTNVIDCAEHRRLSCPRATQPASQPVEQQDGSFVQTYTQQGVV